MPDPTPPRKLRVALLYGGRSTEHEISLESAASVLKNLDHTRYEVIPIYIDPSGAFRRPALPAEGTPPALPTDKTSQALALSPREGQLFAADSGGIDVVFPVIHGPLCEDGSTQGLLELADIAYVGSRVLGSAVCMDKELAKRLVRAEGIPIVPYLTLRGPDYEAHTNAWLERVENELGYPVFVKPATLGSSVGVSRAESRPELADAIRLALRYDDKLLCEKAVRAREIEFAVLAARELGAPPEVSLPGEIVAREGFYSFERKYLDAQGAELKIPAAIDGETLEQAQRAASRIFLILECEGLARIDFFLDRDSGVLYFNEVNTLPGFTSISMYPKLWAATGVSYAELLDRLIADAVQRHRRRSNLQRQR